MYNEKENVFSYKPNCLLFQPILKAAVTCDISLYDTVI